MAEGVAIGAVPTPEQEYSFDNESAFRDEYQRFAEVVNAKLQAVPSDTVSGFTVMPDSGRWFQVGAVNAVGATGTLTFAEDVAYYVPFVPLTAITLTDLAFEITTLAAGATARIGLYANAAQFKPGALIVESGDISTATTGIKTFTLGTAQSLTAGAVYWCAVAGQAGAPIIRSRNAAVDSLGVGAATAPTSLAASTHATEALGASWTALPDPAGTVTWTTGQYPSMVGKV